MGLLNELIEKSRNYPMLTIEEAKQLSIEMMNCNDNILKYQIRDKIFFGTLYSVFGHIKNLQILNFSNGICSEEDIISSFMLEWLEQVEKGALLKSDYISNIYFKHINQVTFGNKMGLPIINTNVIVGLKYRLFLKYIVWFFNEKDNNDISIINLRNKLEEDKIEIDKSDINKLYDILNLSYNLLTNNENMSSNVGGSSIRYFIKIYLYDLIYLRQSSIYEFSYSFEEEVLNILSIKELLYELLNNINLDGLLKKDINKYFDILFIYYNINNYDKPISGDVIAKKYNITTARVNQIIKELLTRLKELVKDSKYQDAYNDIRTRCI